MQANLPDQDLHGKGIAVARPGEAARTRVDGAGRVRAFTSAGGRAHGKFTVRSRTGHSALTVRRICDLRHIEFSVPKQGLAICAQ
ncbi:hypothetical protein GCM10017778_33910 [Streptomyces vinaceus]|nr:hypothetical protein GCM10017778_33910 [Streptomyces vinaceus]